MIIGTQDSEAALGTNHLQFFLADPDPSGHGEGKTLIFDTVQPPGFVAFRLGPLTAAAPVSVGDPVTATATVAWTSEFSANVVVAANQPPIADAGPAQTVLPGANVTLNGSGSVDPDALPSGSSIQNGSFTWTQTAGPFVALSNPTSSLPSFVALVAGIYTFTLVVSDTLDVSTNPASVTVLVGSPGLEGVPTVGPAALLLLALALAAAGWFAVSRS